jgi:hypothetical protein
MNIQIYENGSRFGWISELWIYARTGNKNDFGCQRNVFTAFCTLRSRVGVLLNVTALLFCADRLID